MTDHQLLRDYAINRSDAAFAGLIDRYVALIYSAALRQVGDAHEAQDVTQAVFIVLAQKAGRLPAGTVLSGWLLKTTRYAASSHIRTAIRRTKREQEAAMQSLLNESDSATWEQLMPRLDEAMASLADTDRNAIALRYFENKTAREIATTLQLTEDTAQRRVSRALEKLRKFFAKRGLTLTVTAIATAVSANSVQAAPAGMAAKISVTAGTGLATTSITAMVKGAMKMLFWTKFKTAITATAVILLAAGSITAGIALDSNTRNNNTPMGAPDSNALNLFTQVQKKYASLDSLSYEGAGVFQAQSKTNHSIFSVRLARPCSYRTERHTTGGSQADSLSWSSGDDILSYISWLTNTLYRIRETPTERLKHFDGLYLDFASLPTCLPTQFFYASDSQNPFQNQY